MKNLIKSIGITILLVSGVFAILVFSKVYTKEFQISLIIIFIIGIVIMLKYIIDNE